MQETKRMKLWQRIIIIVLAVIFALIAILAGIIMGVWHNEIFTLASIKQVRERDDSHLDGSVYQMNVKGGFYFEEFLARGGAKSDKELISYITDSITKGLISMGIGETEIACSSFTAETESGDKLFARNYDFAKTNTCLVFTEAREGRHASFSTVDLQFIGINPDEGINGLMDKITSARGALRSARRNERRGSKLRDIYELSGRNDGTDESEHR